ncbi:hypothetical protein CAEBREN_21229 [Caenorhabditis brenneri]|uniref:Uncharacterized protein n=1 Tax=Caenorhabditis brenneri TaxID=135651 RepID=G0MDT8_CAEBE|nr:hypothetical protein CAEBREN_21229 [Caenorhabditis brenneri]
MSSEALSRRTHCHVTCRSNKEWLENSAGLVFTLTAFEFLIYFFIVCFYYSEINISAYTSSIICHLCIPLIFGFIYPFIISFYINKITSPVGYRNCSIFNTILTISMTILMINFIILKWYSEMDQKLSYIHFISLFVHYEYTPVVICTYAFVSYILWRMSKVKPDYDGDEPYLVIYGGEGSVTKKLLDYSE